MNEKKCKKCGKILFSNDKNNLCEACINKRVNKGMKAAKAIGSFVVVTALGALGAKKK
jgi:hypothetical protein